MAHRAIDHCIFLYIGLALAFPARSTAVLDTTLDTALLKLIEPHPTPLGTTTLFETTPAPSEEDPFPSEPTTSASQEGIRDQIARDIADLIEKKARETLDGKKLEQYAKFLLDNIVDKETIPVVIADINRYIILGSEESSKENAKRAYEAINKVFIKH